MVIYFEMNTNDWKRQLCSSVFSAPLKFFTASIRLCLSYGCLFFLCAWQLKEDIFSLISNDHLLSKYWLLPRSKWSTTWSSLATVNWFGRRIKIWTWAKHWDSSKEKNQQLLTTQTRKEAAENVQDTFQDEAEDQVEKKRTRSDSRCLSKYEQLREKILQRYKIWGMSYFLIFNLFFKTWMMTQIFLNWLK